MIYNVDVTIAIFISLKFDPRCLEMKYSEYDLWKVIFSYGRGTGDLGLCKINLNVAIMSDKERSCNNSRLMVDGGMTIKSLQKYERNILFLF